MANFNINVQALPEEPYINDPAIGFFNVFRGTYTAFENSTNMELRKINSEVLLRDIIKNNNAIILPQNKIEVIDNTSVVPVQIATIPDPISLNKIAFIIKEVYFEDATTSTITATLPHDLFQIGSSPSSLSDLNFAPNTGTAILTEYQISDLENLYIKNYPPNTFFQDCIRGYIDICYNFRKGDVDYQQNLDDWSVLRVQFGFADNMSTFAKPYYFNQINIISQSDLDNEIIATGGYPIELFKGTDFNGELIPIYYFGADNVIDDYAHIEFASRSHLPANPGNTVFNVDLDDGSHPLNKRNPIQNHNISVITDNSGIQYEIADMVTYEGAAVLPGNGRRWSSMNIFAVIEDLRYIPLT